MAWRSGHLHKPVQHSAVGICGPRTPPPQARQRQGGRVHLWQEALDSSGHPAADPSQGAFCGTASQSACLQGPAARRKAGDACCAVFELSAGWRRPCDQQTRPQGLQGTGFVWEVVRWHSVGRFCFLKVLHNFCVFLNHRAISLARSLTLWRPVLIGEPEK